MKNEFINWPSLHANHGDSNDLPHALSMKDSAMMIMRF